MISSAARFKQISLAAWGAAGAAAGCGAIYGLALARLLFEFDPQRFGWSGTWPGALAFMAVSLAAAALLSLLSRRIERVFPYAPWAPMALALSLVSLLAPDVNLLRSITLLLGAGGLFVVLFFEAPGLPLPGSGSGDSLPRARTPKRPYPPTLSLFLFLILFFLFVRTLAPAVGQADTFEFQVDVARLGIAHGSGYPLLILVGRLFTLLPLGGTLAYRANLSSAFFAALAALGVERLGRRLGARPVVATLAGLAFGTSPTLWSRAVEIEVFALNAAFVAAILYLGIDLILQPPRSTSISPALANNRLPRLMLLAFLFGLSLTNHLTSLFLGPACLLSAWLAVQRRQRLSVQETPVAQGATPAARHGSRPSSLLRQHLGMWARCSAWVLLAFLLGLSIYLYLPLRWPAVNRGEPLSLAGFANILTGSEAKGAFNWRLPFEDPGRYAIVWSKIVVEYGWPGLVLAALGVTSLVLPIRTPTDNGSEPETINSIRLRFSKYYAQRPTTNYLILFLLLLTSLGYLYFALAFNVPDPSFSSYLIPLHLITAVLMALGVQWLLNCLARLIGMRSSVSSEVLPLASRLLPPATCLLLSALCLLPLSSIWRNLPLVDRSKNLAAQRLGELMLSQPLARGAAILADSQKIAPLDYLQIAEGRRPDLDIIVLPNEASYRAALDERLAAGQVVYLGRYLPGLGSAYSLRSVGPLAEVSAAPFTSTSLELTPSLAQPVADGIDLAGYAKTSEANVISATAQGELNLTLVWRARAVPTENLLINLRLVDPAGQTAWQSVGSAPVSGLYPTNAWRTGEIIPDFHSLQLPLSLAPGLYHLEVALLPPFAPAPASAWATVAPVTLMPPADTMTPPHALSEQFGPVWLSGYDIPESVAPGSHFTVTLYWRRTAEANTVTALGEAHSLAAWPVAATVPIAYHLTAPAGGGIMNLTVDAGQPARCGWLAPTTNACALPSIRLAGQAAAEGAVNFDNQILLNHARLLTAQVAPGGRVTVDLEWQALRAIAADYTVFVHLLGPDGLVHGQVDLWPVSGTRATSGWSPGELIADPYNIQLPADAPPGPYQAEVGLYLLATGERLPVLNADGAPVDDRFLLGGLQVSP